MKKVFFNKQRATHAMALCLAAIALLCGACDEETDGNAALIGIWTSVSATGTIDFWENQPLSDAVNAKIATYDLTGMISIKFDGDGMATNPFLQRWCQYTFKDNILELMGLEQTFKVEINGNEMTFTNNEGWNAGVVMAFIAKNIGATEAETSGLDAPNGTNRINLTVKFRKQ